MAQESPTRLVYHNGELIPEHQAKISIYDSALMFGDMVFEMTRSFNKRQFKLREHLERLYASMRYVGIRILGERRGITRRHGTSLPPDNRGERASLRG